MAITTILRRFPTEQAAINWMEQQRWPEGPVCPSCGVLNEVCRLRTRPGRYTCLACRHQFSITSGTALHRTRLPMRTWLLAMYLIATSSKGVSALKLAAWLGVGYRTAWHVGYRIRQMMAASGAPAGLLRGVVELDETYVGGRPRRVHGERTLPAEERPRRRMGRSTAKPCVFVAVERAGRVVTQLVPIHSAGALGGAVRGTVAPDATLMTDELPAYVGVGREYAGHHRVRHSADEYARTCEATGLRVHVNTAESWNATLKRAIIGVFHRVSRKHLPRYAAESAFRWNERLPALDRLAALLRADAAPLPYAALVAPSAA
ncbi:IS1595 family transposase [Roseisolibacter agri]|uniref:DDE transposase n=1 Tax=Roseisolibacter agri TaxID=2014610 RepID=A0AA37QD98_9BACT|nr:IS1595 family transposase [Roseisolibacter agri]GLC28217.1 DDE transposase [Roseisolibacter agri]